MILVREVLDCLAIIAIYHNPSLVCGFLVGVVHCYTFSSDVMFFCVFLYKWIVDIWTGALVSHKL